MEENKLISLVNILKKNMNWLSLDAIATLMGVSSRSVRNYIANINELNPGYILFSKQGYRIESNKSYTVPENLQRNERIHYILSKLLQNGDGISIHEESFNLSISESTLNNTIIPVIKDMLKEFDLEIVSSNFIYKLMGSESNKRKFIGYLVSNKTYGYFSSGEILEKLFPQFDINKVTKDLYHTCLNANLFLNDYALNNLLIHILIMLIRVTSNNILAPNYDNLRIDELIKTFEQKVDIMELSNKISALIEKNIGFKFPHPDFQQLVILVALSIDKDLKKFENIIEPQFIKSTKEILNNLVNRYKINQFDDDFIMQFSSHLYNAIQRSQFKISYPNPIAKQIKEEYSLVYDMAVFLSHEITKSYSIILNEDEIAFIAFHLGAYIENNKYNESKIKVIIVSDQYHTYTSKLINDIQDIFHKDIEISRVLSTDEYILYRPSTDLVISTHSMQKAHDNTITISPILTKNNIIKIWNEVRILKQKRSFSSSHEFFINLFKEDLFFQEVYFDNEYDYINFIGEKLLSKNYADQDFITDVILRESLSSTSFTKHLAIPHSISVHPNKSFISVIQNKEPFLWGNNHTNFVFLIGIKPDDIRFFNKAFELIINKFDSPDNIADLITAENLENLVEMLMNEYCVPSFY